MQIDDNARLALIKHALNELKDSTDPRAPDARAELLRQMAIVAERMKKPVDQVVQLRPMAMNSKIRGA